MKESEGFSSKLSAKLYFWESNDPTFPRLCESREGKQTTGLILMREDVKFAS